MRELRDGSHFIEVTADVHWSWKGNVPTQAVTVIEKVLDGPELVKAGDRRVFFGSPETAEERGKSCPGSTTNVVAWVLGHHACGSALQLAHGLYVNHGLRRPL